MAEETAEQIADRVVQKWLLTRGADATQSESLREPLGRAEGKNFHADLVVKAVEASQDPPVDTRAGSGTWEDEIR